MVIVACLLAGCGSSGGTLTDDVICRGSGVVVGGRATFVKRLYDNRGLTGVRVTKPVRYAQVDIVLAVDGRTLLTTHTDGDGYYCVQVRGVPVDFPTVYPRVASKTDPDRFKINVIDRLENLPNASLYSRPGAGFNGAASGIYDVDIEIPVTAQVGANVQFPLAGAFNILDVVTTGAETAIELTGQAPSTELFVAWTPGTVFGSGTFGTYFTGSDPLKRAAGIELSGGDGGGPDAGNHDEYDDDVIFHEYGHFMADFFSKGAEVGGAHFLNDNTQDIRLAWSEGWATFFSAATRNKPDMVNSYGGDPGTPNQDLSYSFNIETPHADVLTAIGTPLEEHGTYTTSEVAVASVLWRLSRRWGFRAVWESFLRLESAPANVSLDTFAGIFDAMNPSANFSETAKLRRVQLFQDGDEPFDNVMSPSTTPVAASGIVGCHTLYPAGDIDYLRIELAAPGTVTVETFNLSNGADTVLQLVNAAGDVLLTNDNSDTPRRFDQVQLTGCGNRQVFISRTYFDLGVNNGERLASRVASPVLAPGVYYARVMSRETFDPQGRNFAAGALGSYDAMVTVTLQ